MLSAFSSQPLYTVEQIRCIEKNALQSNFSEDSLMHKAGLAGFKALRRYYPHISRLDVVCGKGNNGGDGYVIARLAAEEGIAVNVYALADIKDLPISAQKAAMDCRTSAAKIYPYTENTIFNGEVIVDAVLGIGVKGIVRDLYQNAIQKMNQSSLPIVAVDIPSGLDADEGGVLGDAIIADLTITFIGIKRGMLTGFAANHCGKIICDDLELPNSLYYIEDKLSAQTISKNTEILPKRKPATYKGTYGHVLLIGGDQGMGGAVCLAAEAALRTGAGLVTVVTRPEHVSALLARCPEIMCQGLTEGENVNSLSLLLKKATVCVIGPGMKNSPWSNNILNWIVENLAQFEMLSWVIDAGALRTIFFQKLLKKNLSVQHWVLTPHPGEAATLLEITSYEVQQKRFTCVKNLQKKCGGTVILKGAGTLVYDNIDNPIQVLPYSNPAMATAGMGDVLSGIIGGLIAQGCTPAQAASKGVLLHAKAGEKVSQMLKCRSILAHELFPYLSCR